MSPNTTSFYLLKCRTEGGDSWEILFDRPLTPEERYKYLDRLYNINTGCRLEEWITWSFESIRITHLNEENT